MRGPLVALLLLAAVGAYADYLLRAGSPEWDNVAAVDGDGAAARARGTDSGGSGFQLLELEGGGGELLQGGEVGPGFSGSGSGSGTPFITVNVLS